jgi:hypothetical protein
MARPFVPQKSITAYGVLAALGTAAVAMSSDIGVKQLIALALVVVAVLALGLRRSQS